MQGCVCWWWVRVFTVDLIQEDYIWCQQLEWAGKIISGHKNECDIRVSGWQAKTLYRFCSAEVPKKGLIWPNNLSARLLCGNVGDLGNRRALPPRGLLRKACSIAGKAFCNAPGGEDLHRLGWVQSGMPGGMLKPGASRDLLSFSLYNSLVISLIWYLICILYWLKYNLPNEW